MLVQRTGFLELGYEHISILTQIISKVAFYKLTSVCTRWEGGLKLVVFRAPEEENLLMSV